MTTVDSQKMQFSPLINFFCNKTFLKARNYRFFLQIQFTGDKHVLEEFLH